MTTKIFVHTPKLPAWTDWGGYPLAYHDESEGDVLCADCATEECEKRNTVGDFDFGEPKPVAFVHYEGPSEFCAACNEEIESAYGDPEAKENEE